VRHWRPHDNEPSSLTLPENAYGPSPPEAVQERGSHGLSVSFALLGALKRSLLGLGVVVVVVVGVTELVAVAVTFGAFTEKFVPVTTVTWAPPSTMEGL
jgi:hypothetical protein